jgi:hypothetical protein
MICQELWQNQQLLLGASTAAQTLQLPVRSCVRTSATLLPIGAAVPPRRAFSDREGSTWSKLKRRLQRAALSGNRKGNPSAARLKAKELGQNGLSQNGMFLIVSGVSYASPLFI